MKTIKVIDLLNRIAGGEKIPKRIKWGDHILTWFVYEHKALDELGDPNLFECAGSVSCRLLNDTIEIIEELPKEDKKIERVDRELDNDGYLSKKLNEIIDKVNGE